MATYDGIYHYLCQIANFVMSKHLVGQPVIHKMLHRSNEFLLFRRMKFLHNVCFQYKATDFVVSKPGMFRMSFVPDGGHPKDSYDVFHFEGTGGVCMGMYNTDDVSVVQFLQFKSEFFGI